MLYDTEGCMSLHALFVEREAAVGPHEFAVILARALERAAAEFPLGSRDPLAAARTAAARDRAAFRAAAGDGEFFADRDASYLVLLDPPRDEPPPFLPRTLAMYGVGAPAEALAYLARHRLAIEAIAVAGARPEIVAAAIRAGAARIAAFGQLQAPPHRQLSRRTAAHRAVRSLDRGRNVSDELFESVVTPVPGPHSVALAAALQRYESPNVTYFGAGVPIFWESASGATVTDVDGNRYLDLTSAFGVAGVGHANPRVTAAIARQAERLMHGMGDVHPTRVRAQLLERLARIFPPI